MGILNDFDPMHWELMPSLMLAALLSTAPSKTNLLFSSNIIENFRICETCKFQLVASDVPCFNTCSVSGETTVASRDKPKCT